MIQIRFSEGRDFILRCVVLLTLSVFLAGCAKGRPLTPAAVERHAPISRSVATSESPVHVELTRVVYRLNADGTYEKTVRQRYRILNQSGVENWAYSQAYWSPWYMDQPSLDVTVTNERPSGGPEVLKLDPTTISVQPAFPDAPEIYGDSRVLRAPLPSVRVGSVIDETIRSATHRPFISKEHMHSIPFQIAVPQDSVELVVDAPSNLAVHFEVRDAKVTRSESQSGDRVRYVFRGGPYDGLEAPEPLVPTDVPRWPSLDFGTSLAWAPLAANYSSIVEEKLSGVDFSSTVEKLVNETDSDFEKAAKLFSWVKSKIRYVGIEFGESGVIPSAPDETVARGYGDCKDQATLLVGLLRAADLPAHLALLNVGSAQDVNGKLAALNVFDHAIVVVSTEKPMWFDPTADHVRPGALPVADQQRFALVASADTKGLVRTPAAVPETNYYHETRKVYLSAHGRARVMEYSTGTGYMEAELRRTFARPPDAVKEDLERYAEKVYYTKEVSEPTHGKTDDLLTAFDVRLEVSNSNVGYTDVLDASVEAREDVLLSWLPAALTDSEEERKTELVLPVPYSAKIVWEIYPPPGYEPTKLPAETRVEMGPASLVRSIAKKDRTVVVQTSFTTGQTELSPAQVKAFRDAWEAYQKTPRVFVEFAHQAKMLSDSGNPTAAVRLLQEEIAKTPDDAVARLRLARVLLPYVKEEAYEQARKAATLAPKDAVLQKEVARLLSEDEFGDDLSANSDAEGALDAYRRAFRLDPDDVESRLREAVILEHDEKGERYASSHLDQAVEIYDSIPEQTLREFSDGGFRNNALFALFWAHRNQEVEQRILKLEREDLPIDLAVMNAAALRGADGSLAEAKRLGLTGAERANALEAASSVLVKNRNYPEAVRVLEEAMASSDGAVRLQTRVQTLRKVQKVDVQSLSEATPGAMVKKVFALAIGGQDPQALARRYLASRAWHKPEASTVKHGINSMARGASSAAMTGVTGEMLVDFAVGGIEVVVDGSDSLGYRVRVNTRYGAQNQLDVYVVKQGSEYKIRAIGDQRGELGAEALHAAESGDLKRARQWLDWARESYHAPSGEDPLRIAPFARLYDAGKGDVRVSAAALASSLPYAPAAVTVLEKAAAEGKNDEHRAILDHALAGAYASSGNYEKQLRVGRALSQRLPRSRVAGGIVLQALWDLGRFDEVVNVLKARLKTAESDERRDIEERLARARTAQGRLKEARAILMSLNERKPKASRYNSLAWDGLFLGVQQQDLELALKAVEMWRYDGHLHTLAAVYAELGRLEEARQTLQELLRQRKNRQPSSIDWFVLGRIAEHLGLEKAALNAYAKVEKPATPWPTSTYALTQQRVARLKKK